jgi:uncharacterized UPF0160 family protein
MSAKKQKTHDSMQRIIKTIATHSGSFHADESLAVFMLRKLTDYADSKLVRTRDLEIIKQADIVVDVGAIYDPASNRFDHHQRGFEETFSSEYDIKLSSAGLIYKHFGKQVIANILNWPIDKPELELVYQKVYDGLILMFDGVDNGVNQYPGDVAPKYVDGTNIASRVSRLNPRWNEPFTDEIALIQFEKAVVLTGQELVAKVEDIAFSWLPAREIVLQGWKTRHEVHKSGKIVLLPQYCPWQSHLADLEEEFKLQENELPLYAVFADSSGSWRVRAISVSSDSFISRKPLPEPWRGIRDEELSKLTGIPDCVFVHASGFIGGTKSKDSALKMASHALDYH